MYLSPPLDKSRIRHKENFEFKPVRLHKKLPSRLGLGHTPTAFLRRD